MLSPHARHGPFILEHDSTMMVERNDLGITMESSSSENKNGAEVRAIDDDAFLFYILHCVR